MASTKGAEAIARLLECPICLEHQKDSRILPCLHSLCFECLLKYVTLSSTDDGETDSMRCPTCRKECKIPEGGVGEFPKNFLINSLEDCFKDVKVERPELPEGVGSEPGICQNSAKAGRHGAVVVFCKECNLYICQSCSDSHSFFDSTQNHSLIPVKVTEENVAADLPCCKIHDDHKMALYCRTCDVAVCSMCCLESHKDHHYVELPAASEECGSLLEKMNIEICQHIAELDRITEELSQTQTTMKADFNQLRDEIDTVEGNSSLLGKLKSCEEEALMVVNGAVKEHELQKTNAMSLQSYIETLRQPSTDHHGLITCVRGLKKQLASQTAQLPLLAKWTLLRVPLEKSASRVAGGEISMTTTRSSASSSSGCRDDGQIHLGRSVQTINLKCSKIAPAFVVTRGVMAVVHWGDPHLWVYSTGGVLIKRSRVTDMQYAAGMALLPADEIKVIITDFRSAFFVVTLSPKYDIRRQVRTKVSLVPRRVCVDVNTGEPIVASNSAKEILQLDAAANIVRRIPIDKHRICSLWCAAKDGEDYMMADSGNNIVAWADSSGTITHIYGKRRGEDLHHPCHLVKDGQGRTIVVDHMNDAVQLLGTDRTYLQHLLTRRDEIESPTSVHLDEESGFLYVAHGPENAPKVNVYNYITKMQTVSGNVTHLQLTVKL